MMVVMAVMAAAQHLFSNLLDIPIFVKRERLD